MKPTSWERLYWVAPHAVTDQEPDLWVVDCSSRSILPEHRLIIDIGCGTGRHLRAMSRSGLHLIGIDGSLSALAMLREKGVRRVCADVNALPLAEQCADLIICTDVLGVVQDPQAVLMECRRVLKMDRTAIISVQNVEDQTFGVGQLIRQDDGVWEFEQAGLLFRFFEERAIRAMLEATGFRVVNLERYVREDTPHRHRPVAHSHHLMGVLVSGRE